MGVLKAICVHALLILIPLGISLYGAEYILYLSIEYNKAESIEAIRQVAKKYKARIKSLNKHGFRTRSFDGLKTKDQFRVLILGDSFTYGPYMPYEVTYPSVLEAKLRTSFPDVDYRVYAVAKTGLSVFDHEQNLKKFGPIIKPDIIVYGFCHNDVKDGSLGGSVGRSAAFKRSGLRFLFSGLTSMGLGRSSKLLSDGFDVLFQSTGAYPHWTTSFVSDYYDRSTENWIRFKATLQSIRMTASTLSSRHPLFLALNYGIYTDRPSNYSDPDPVLKNVLSMYRQAENEAINNGFLTANFEDEMRRQFADKTTAVMPHDSHPNAELHSVYADKLFRMITQQHQ